MIKGIEIHKLPFNNLTFIGVLQFKEYPSTIIYSDHDKNPYIIEWIDLDEFGKDIYFIYKTSIDNLKKYLDKGISHYDLIINTDGEIVFQYYGKLESASSFTIVPSESIPLELLPTQDSFFSTKYSDDLEKINEHFGLKNHVITALVKQETDIVKYTEIFSNKYNSELIHIHLNNGKFIEHGKVNTNVLGHTLTSFEDLYHEVATDYVRGGKERNIKIESKELKKQFNDLAYTEVVIERAASFSIYIKPKISREQVKLNYDNDSSIPFTEAEKIFSNVKEIMSNTFNADSISSLTEKYNPDVFKKLMMFADNIKKFDLDIDLDYYSPVSKNKWSDKIDINKAYNIIAVLNNKKNETENIKLKGKFSALNCKSKHFTFVANDGNEHTGYFDELIKDNIPNLNFIDLYEINIKCDKTKIVSDSKFTIINTIISALIAE
jgi:hypothetical protein